MRRRARIVRTVKFLLGSLVLFMLYKASKWQDESSSHHGRHAGIEVRLDPRHWIHELMVPTVRFRDWDDESMRLYRQQERCDRKTTFCTNLGPLVAMLSESSLWDWIRLRIEGSWSEWVESLKTMRTRSFTRKTILIIPGILEGTDYAHPDVISAGGPLGELLQWADLIAALYILGHNITLEKDTRGATQRLERFSNGNIPDCGGYDLIYLDVLAMNELSFGIKNAFRCRFRLLDVYGTQAMHNDPEYRKAYNIRSFAGGLGVHLKQFCTFYPQTPDNSFLGFVVKPFRNQTALQLIKQNIGILYGKDRRYVRGHTHFVDILSRFLDIHYTMSESLNLDTQGRLVQAGVLTGGQYRALLTQAKVFIGLGHPVEGTGAMEALAHGCVFINPRRQADGQTEFILRRKPTNRLITSQIPYLEQYVGPPHVYTVDIDNLTEVLLMSQQIEKQKVFESFIPEEFTMTGYLERLSSYLEHQDLCSVDKNQTWPPLSLLRPLLAEDGQSCEDTCHTNGLVCEPVYFKTLNEKSQFKRFGHNCSVHVSGPEVIYPAVDLSVDKEPVCWLQEDARLFSCAGALPERRRLCPCRRYRRHQVALWDDRSGVSLDDDDDDMMLIQ